MGRKTFRDGDSMVAVEIAPAVIEYADIVAATEVIHDREETMAPWDHCDGFEHMAVEPHRLEDAADARKMQGYVRTWDGDTYVIRLPADEDYGIYEHMRAQGASRQVAREAVARERQRTLNQLRAWYRHGWEWYGVKCEMTVLGDTFEDSVWGIDDPEYAENYVVADVAGNVAATLEEAGFTVTGQPEERDLPWRAVTRKDKRAKLARALAEQSWR